MTSQVKSAIKEAITNGIDNATFPSPEITESNGQVTWIKDILAPYCDGTWEVFDNELLESYGIIALKTVEGFEPRQIDFIRVSNNSLTDDYRKSLGDKNKFRNRTGLVNEDDVIERSKSNSLMVKGVNGNVELMETLLVINQLGGIEGRNIGNIMAVNPRYANGLKMSNEEMLYCWNKLNSLDAVKVNKVSSGDIKFASKYQLAR
jgi:hypothetical protein